jgi:hypothetical protein
MTVAPTTSLNCPRLQSGNGPSSRMLSLFTNNNDLCPGSSFPPSTFPLMTSPIRDDAGLARLRNPTAIPPGRPPDVVNFVFHSLFLRDMLTHIWENERDARRKSC